MHLFQENAPSDHDAALAQLAIIDLGPYLKGEPGALEATAAEICRACETIGFFYISNHGVDEALIEATFEQSRRFHALPLGSK
jgi:isopenicillin N synthase-like dioxygenase